MHVHINVTGKGHAHGFRFKVDTCSYIFILKSCYAPPYPQRMWGRIWAAALVVYSHIHFFSSLTPPPFKENVKQIGFGIQIFTLACFPHALVLSLSLQKQVQRESWTSSSYFMLSICFILCIKETLFFGYQSKLYCTILSGENLGLKWNNPRICSFMNSFSFCCFKHIKLQYMNLLSFVNVLSSYSENC